MVAALSHDEQTDGQKTRQEWATSVVGFLCQGTVLLGDIAERQRAVVTDSQSLKRIHAVAKETITEKLEKLKNIYKKINYYIYISYFYINRGEYFYNKR